MEAASAKASVARADAATTAMADRCRHLEAYVQSLERQLTAAEEGLAQVEASFCYTEELHDHLDSHLLLPMSDTDSPGANGGTKIGEFY
eukprot:SAG31_NODE_5520_length_2482_cov_1.771297_2_plen_89_part_00